MADERDGKLRLVFIGIVLLLSGIIYLLLPFSAASWWQTPSANFLTDPNTTPLIRFSDNSPMTQFGLMYLTGLVILLIGAGTFWMRPQTRAAQLFALFAAFAGLAVGALFDQVTSQKFVRIWIFAFALVGSSNLSILLIFPYKVKSVIRWPSLKWFVWLPGVVLALWAQLWLSGPGAAGAYFVPWRMAYLLNSLALILTLGVIIYRASHSPSPLVRQQARIILGGAIFGFAPLLIYLLAYSFASARWLAYVTSLLIVYPLAVAYSIVRYRMMDAAVYLRAGLTYALLVGILTGIVTSLALVVRLVARIDSPATLAFFVVLVVILLNPLRVLLQRGVDRYLLRRPVTLDQLLNAYSKELTTAVSVDQLATTLLKYIAIAAPEVTPKLYLPDDVQGSYASYGDQNGQPLDISSPLVQFLRQESGVIDLTEERAWPKALRGHRQEIARLNASVIVPMISGQELLGWLTLSHEERGAERFQQSELNFYSSLANQSLIGLERASVIRRLEARISELNLLSQFSQYLSFTVMADDLLELIYTNYQRLLGIEDFNVYLKDPVTQNVYTVFCVEADERVPHKEGLDQLISDLRILQVTETGQAATAEDEAGDTWIILPLNAGADTLGALHTPYRGATSKMPERQEQLVTVFADRAAVALERLQTRQQLETRAQQLEIINQITFSLASTLELTPLLNLILDKAIELLKTAAGTFMLVIEDTGELEFRVVRGPSSQELVGTRLPIGAGLAGTAAQTGQAVLVNRVQEDTRWFDQVDAGTQFQTESILTVPMLRQNTVLGVLQVINKQNDAPFNEEDQMLLTAFAGQAVVALENARLLEQTDKALQKRVKELSMLQQLDRDLNTTLALDHVLKLTLDWILRICSGTSGLIVLADDEQRLRLQAFRGQDERFDPSSVDDERLKSGMIGQVFESGQPDVCDNIHQRNNELLISDSIHSQMTLPIIHKQNLIGVLVIGSDKFDAFDKATLESAGRVTNHAAVAIANAILVEQINEANQAKSEFVSMVSHELKTPMTSMRGYTDLMLSGMTGEINQQQRNFLETIAANIGRMSKQIQDLTDISRIETGRLHMETAPTAFTNIVSETLQSVKGPCDNKHIELHLDLPADLPLIMADKERLVQVLTNLISNACKYSPADTDVYVSLKEALIVMKKDQPPIPMIVCSVKDKGYGISEEDQKQLFTKFFRADDPNIRKASGTGLGLSITRGIVEFHGGKIWVESQIGQGTTFHFAIPQVLE